VIKCGNPDNPLDIHSAQAPACAIWLIAISDGERDLDTWRACTGPRAAPRCRPALAYGAIAAGDSGLNLACHPASAPTNPKDFTMTLNRRNLHKVLLATAVGCTLASVSSAAPSESAQDLDRESMQALQILYRSNPAAAAISGHAKAILVFPKIIKAGLVFGGSYGEGVLLERGQVVDYYNSVSASWGLQVGAQSYAYVVFLMSDRALRYLEKTDGWEFGVGPTVVVVNEGVARNLSTTTLKSDAYAFITDQQGLMVSVSLEGTKISRIRR
jgi:lipid-binding SYLF domain-containing protein